MFITCLLSDCLKCVIWKSRLSPIPSLWCWLPYSYHFTALLPQPLARRQAPDSTVAITRLQVVRHVGGRGESEERELTRGWPWRRPRDAKHQGEQRDVSGQNLPNPSRPPSPSNTSRSLECAAFYCHSYAYGDMLQLGLAFVSFVVCDSSVVLVKAIPTQTSPLLTRSTRTHQQLAALHIWMRNSLIARTTSLWQRDTKGEKKGWRWSSSLCPTRMWTSPTRGLY